MKILEATWIFSPKYHHILIVVWKYVVGTFLEHGAHDPFSFFWSNKCTEDAFLEGASMANKFAFIYEAAAWAQLIRWPEAGVFFWEQDKSKQMLPMWWRGSARNGRCMFPIPIDAQGDSLAWELLQAQGQVAGLKQIKEELWILKSERAVLLLSLATLQHLSYNILKCFFKKYIYIPAHHTISATDAKLPELNRFMESAIYLCVLQQNVFWPFSCSCL